MTHSNPPTWSLADLPQTPSRELLLCTLPLFVTKADGLHVGTGFFLRLEIEGGTYVTTIVTNKHVLLGGTHVECRIKRVVDDHIVNDEGAKFILSPPDSVFVFHPLLDLAFIVVPDTHRNPLTDNSLWATYTIAEKYIPNEAVSANLEVLQEVVMIGYPVGISDIHHNLPIARRGTLSTPYHLDFNGRQEFAIDITAVWGSSGSPVFILDEGSWREADGSLSFGRRIHWLGMLWGGPVLGAKSPVPTPTKENDAARNIPLNLGYCIKAAAILDAKQLVFDVLKREGKWN